MIRNIVVILGPTASGKSSLGIALARKFRGVIISADSRQVYQGMDVGTGKITKREMRGVPHFLLDVASPRGQYSVSRYVRDVQKVLQRIPPTTPIFLVGGSPFYLKAVTEPKSFSPVPPNPKLRRRLEHASLPQLRALLKKLDPGRWQSVDPNNRRRIIRAIEIASTHTTYRSPSLAPMRVLKIGIALSRKQLYHNIDQRVDQRVPAMLNETKNLHAAGLSWKRMEAFGLEYRWMSRIVRHLVAEDEGIARLKTDIHGFARRQLTWWRRENDIVWIQQQRSAERLVGNFLNM